MTSRAEVAQQCRALPAEQEQPFFIFHAMFLGLRPATLRVHMMKKPRECGSERKGKGRCTASRSQGAGRYSMGYVQAAARQRLKRGKGVFSGHARRPRRGKNTAHIFTLKPLSFPAASLTPEHSRAHTGTRGNVSGPCMRPCARDKKDACKDIWKGPRRFRRVWS